MTATDGSVTPAKGGRLVAIQYLRGIAALLVVVHHAVHAQSGFFSPLGERVDFGRPGVLIFFVISGFVMMHACRDEAPRQFAKRRIIRVAPLYWMMTLLFFVFVARNDLQAGDPFRRLPELVQSLLFIPHYNAAVPDQIWPILVPGWTLNYEMFFFVVFAIGLIFERPAMVSVAILTALVGLGLLVPGQTAIWRTWTSPFLVLFIAGIGAALWWQRRDFSSVAWMCPAGLMLVVTSALGAVSEAWTDAVFFGAAIITVIGVLGLQDRRPALESRFLAHIGDASYSIYLSHTILLLALFPAVKMLPLSGWAQFIVTLGVVLSGCILAGVMIHHWVEKPMTFALRRKFNV